MKRTAVLFAKGIAFGVANIIPGISGGTMAVIFGFYERLTAAIPGLVLDQERRWEHFRFLVILVLGALAGVGLFAFILDWALQEHERLTYLLFMGLIVGSLPRIVALHPAPRVYLRDVAALIVGLILVLLLSGSGLAKPEVEIADASGLPGWSAPTLLLAAFLAGGAMVMPGVSGSLLLVLLGQYAFILALIKTSIKGLADLTIPPLVPISLIAVGAMAGVVVFALIMNIALRRMPQMTAFLIFGLVGGSAIVLYPGFEDSLSGLVSGVASFSVGALIAFIFSGSEELAQPQKEGA
jgi:putative membrane protein